MVPFQTFLIQTELIDQETTSDVNGYQTQTNTYRLSFSPDLPEGEQVVLSFTAISTSYTNLADFTGSATRVYKNGNQVFIMNASF